MEPPNAEVLPSWFRSRATPTRCLVACLALVPCLALVALPRGLIGAFKAQRCLQYDLIHVQDVRAIFPPDFTHSETFVGTALLLVFGHLPQVCRPIKSGLLGDLQLFFTKNTLW